MNLELQIRSDDKLYGGESWLWCNNGLRAVVDIGNATEFRRRASSFSPNIVVFTHDDSDHIGRLGHAEEFINDVRMWPNVSKEFRNLLSRHTRDVEFWLPMDWLHLGRAALQLLEKPSAPSVEQICDEPSVDDELNNKFSLNYFEPARSDLDVSRESEPDPEEDEQRCSVLSGDFEVLQKIPEGDIAEAVEEVVASYREGVPRKQLPGTDNQIAKRAEESVRRVGAILAALARHRLPVRLFDVDRAWLDKKPLWHTEGIPGDITIVNAVDRPLPPTTKFRNSARAVLFASRLTVQNRRALVTFLWPTLYRRYRPKLGNFCDGALIWSDSEGKVCGLPPTGKVVPWRYVGVMSAPHHGSDDRAHEPLWDYRPPNVKVVLSNNKESDTERWFNIPRTQRDCALCGYRRRTPVRAFSDNDSFGVRLCSYCKR